MRIIIAGGRDFQDYNLVKHNAIQIMTELAYEKCEKRFLDNGFEYVVPIDKNYEIVSGTANGADKLGERFAKDFGLKIARFPADWDKFGKSAGYKRNEQMALYAKEDNGVLIAFWNGSSKGTRHMIDLANKHGLRVFIVNY